MLAINGRDPEVLAACNAINFYTSQIAELDAQQHSADAMVVLGQKTKNSHLGISRIVFGEREFQRTPDPALRIQVLETELQ